jgi:hypothetical protein
MNMKGKLSILFLIITIHCYSQTQSEFLKNSVVKNILFYESQNDNIILDSMFVNSPFPTGSFFWYLPDKDYYLDIKITPIDFKIPDTNFEIYSVFNDFTYQNYFEDKQLQLASNNGIQRKYYLVGQRNTYEIIFISGDFYLSKIAHFFNLNLNYPEHFTEFLRLKTYEYLCDNIEYLKTTKNNLVFTAYSKRYNSEVIILVNKNCFDKIEIEWKN